MNEEPRSSNRLIMILGGMIILGSSVTASMLAVADYPGLRLAIGVSSTFVGCAISSLTFLSWRVHSISLVSHSDSCLGTWWSVLS